MKSIASKGADYAARFICVIALIWFGIIVSHAVSGVSKSGGKVGLPTVAGHATEVDSVLSLEAGRWNFAGSDLAVERISCDEIELKELLDGICAGSNSAKTIDIDAAELVELAKLNGATHSKNSRGVIWAYDGTDSCMRLLVTAEDEPKLLASSIAMKVVDRWEVTNTVASVTSKQCLLPMPSETEVLCSRQHDDGKVQLQLLTTSMACETLLDRWRSSGWEIRHTEWGHVNSFSYLCAKNDSVVYAWSRSNRGTRTLMLSSASAAIELTNQILLQ